MIPMDAHMVMSFQLETEKKIISVVTHLIEKDMMRHECRIQKSPGSPFPQERTTVNCLLHIFPYTSSSVFVCKYRYKYTPIFIERDT